MKTKITYFLVGILLLVFNYQNRITSIDRTTLNLIEEVNSYDTEKLWTGFKNRDYIKDIRYNSSKEFRYDRGNIIKKSPDQPVASIEALKERDTPLIKAIPFEKFRDIIDLGNSSNSNAEIKYKSVIIHESFHCFQMEHGLSEVIDITDDSEYEDPKYQQFQSICKKLDEDDIYKKLWETEYKSLLSLYKNRDSSEYEKSRNKRLAYIKSKFPKDYDTFIEILSYQEFIEGTARFVEEKYMVDQYNDPYIKYRDRLFNNIDESSYSEGSLKAKILDRYAPNWKCNLDFSKENNFDKIFKEGNIL